MWAEIVWIKGHPEKFGWYLVTVESNDPEPIRSVKEVWFNPMSTGSKFWIGEPGSNCSPLNKKVVAYAKKPEPYSD